MLINWPINVAKRNELGRTKSKMSVWRGKKSEFDSFLLLFVVVENMS